MDNLQPVSNIDPSDLPDGFSASNPVGPSSAQGGADGGSGAQRQQEIEEQKQAILEQALTPDALARLRRIKLVKPEKASQVENGIAAMAMSGKLPGRINEGKLIEMLERGNASAAGASGKSITIQRKRYAFDSDDEDDNDDDLM